MWLSFWQVFLLSHSLEFESKILYLQTGYDWLAQSQWAPCIFNFKLPIGLLSRDWEEMGTIGRAEPARAQHCLESMFRARDRIRGRLL